MSKKAKLGETIKNVHFSPLSVFHVHIGNFAVQWTKWMSPPYLLQENKYIKITVKKNNFY